MVKIKEKRRVVVTGLGVISSLGIGWQEFWKNLLAGKSGISKIVSFDTSSYDRHFGGEVKNFDPTQFIDKRKVKQMGRASQMAIAAAKLALKDAKLDLKEIDSTRAGVCIGTTMGEPQVFEVLARSHFPKAAMKIDNFSALTYPSNEIVLNMMHEFKLSGENLFFGNACSAGNYALGYAFDLVSQGYCDLVFAGGVDALSQIAFTGFNRLLAMAPEKCQPFDKDRKGMMLGEGSGILILESLDNAQKRNVLTYAEILGYGLSCDAASMTASNSAEMKKATLKALRSAGLRPEDVDYISAHGTGTKENDKEECQAIQDVFGERARKIPISSIKSMLGHTMGAAAAIEAITCCLAIKDGKVPPTINFMTKDPECDIDCVPNRSRKQKVKVVLNNSQAFGGNNACVVCRKII